MKEDAVCRILFPMRLLHPQKQVHIGKWNGHSSNLGNFNRPARFGVLDPTRRDHKIYQNFVGHTDDRVITQIVISQFEDRLVRQNFERRFHPSLIIQVAIEKKIDVFSGAQITVMDDSKTSDHKIARPAFVQRPAERYEIVFFGDSARVR